MDRPRHVLYCPHAKVIETRRQFAYDLVVNGTGDVDLSRLAQSFDSRGNVNAFPVNVVALDDDIAHRNADPEDNAAVLWKRRIALCEFRLNCERTAHRIYGARKLDQNSVSCGLDDAPAVSFDPRCDQLSLERFETGMRLFLICLDQSGISNHVGSEDRGKPSPDMLRTHGGRSLAGISSNETTAAREPSLSRPNVRSGSIASRWLCAIHFRFAPKSGHAAAPQ